MLGAEAHAARQPPALSTLATLSVRQAGQPTCFFAVTSARQWLQTEYETPSVEATGHFLQLETRTDRQGQVKTRGKGRGGGRFNARGAAAAALHPAVNCGHMQTETTHSSMNDALASSTSWHSERFHRPDTDSVCLFIMSLFPPPRHRGPDN